VYPLVEIPYGDGVVFVMWRGDAVHPEYAQMREKLASGTAIRMLESPLLKQPVVLWCGVPEELLVEYAKAVQAWGLWPNILADVSIMESEMLRLGQKISRVVRDEKGVQAAHAAYDFLFDSNDDFWLKVTVLTVSLADMGHPLVADYSGQYAEQRQHACALRRNVCLQNEQLQRDVQRGDPKGKRTASPARNAWQHNATDARQAARGGGHRGRMAAAPNPKERPLGGAVGDAQHDAQAAAAADTAPADDAMDCDAHADGAEPAAGGAAPAVGNGVSPQRSRRRSPAKRRRSGGDRGRSRTPPPPPGDGAAGDDGTGGGGGPSSDGSTDGDGQAGGGRRGGGGGRGSRSCSPARTPPPPNPDAAPGEGAGGIGDGGDGCVSFHSLDCTTGFVPQHKFATFAPVPDSMLKNASQLKLAGDKPDVGELRIDPKRRASKHSMNFYKKYKQFCKLRLFIKNEHTVYMRPGTCHPMPHLSTFLQYLPPAVIRDVEQQVGDIAKVRAARLHPGEDVDHVFDYITPYEFFLIVHQPHQQLERRQLLGELKLLQYNTAETWEHNHGRLLELIENDCLANEMTVARKYEIYLSWLRPAGESIRSRVLDETVTVNGRTVRLLPDLSDVPLDDQPAYLSALKRRLGNLMVQRERTRQADEQHTAERLAEQHRRSIADGAGKGSGLRKRSTDLQLGGSKRWDSDQQPPPSKRRVPPAGYRAYRIQGTNTELWFNPEASVLDNVKLNSRLPRNIRGKLPREYREFLEQHGYCTHCYFSHPQQQSCTEAAAARQHSRGPARQPQPPAPPAPPPQQPYYWQGGPQPGWQPPAQLYGMQWAPPVPPQGMPYQPAQFGPGSGAARGHGGPHRGRGGGRRGGGRGGRGGGRMQNTGKADNNH
jgi:uncharacterized membrane protein YgcG